MTRRQMLLTAAGATWCSAAPTPERAISLRLSLRAEDNQPLPAGAVQLMANGTAAKMKALSADPMILSVVLDLAGDLTLAAPARDALVAEIQKTNATVALLRAQDGLRVLADPGTPKDRLAATIQELNISGRAGMLETIVPAAMLADSVLRSARVRSAVLFVSDSLISNYRQDYTNPVVNSSDANDLSRRFPEGLVKEKIRQLKEELAGTLAPVFLVHLNYQSDRLNEAYQTGLMDLVGSSGGTATFCRTIADIAPNIQKAFEAIAALQVADVDAVPGKGRQIELSVQSERPVAYRSRYVVPRPVPVAGKKSPPKKEK